MRRIYFLVPNSETAKEIVSELLLSHVEERHIHVIAKQGISLDQLPKAGLLQKSDFWPSLEQGIAMGAATGFLGGLVAMVLPTGLVLGGAAVAAITLAGAGVGGLMSSMIGVDVANRRIERYRDAVETGELLLIIDVPWDRVEDVEALIKRHHPDAECEGVDPHTFP